MPDEKAPFHNPFAQLKSLRGDRATEPPTPATPAPPPAPAAPPGRATGPSIPRAVVRLERTGRGGKEVTVIEHLGVPPVERERWLKALKGALGCGGVVEGESLVLQGDHRARLPKILTARGVKKVTVS